MITVIIPAYNAEKTISTCLESVLSQNTETEIILVDDGSADETLKVSEKYADRVQILQLSHCGVSEARNAGLAASNGEWVVFLDSDDTLLPCALEKLLSHMTGDNDAVCGTILRGNEVRKASGKVRSIPAGHALMDFVLADPTNFLTIHGWAFRILTEMPLFDSSLRLGEDSDWVLRYLYLAKKAVFIPDPVYRYTLSASSTVHEWKANQCNEYLKMLEILSRGTAGKETNWPLLVLINYLLILTHVVFHPDNPSERKQQFAAAQELREYPLITNAFDCADLSKLSYAKRIVLTCLRRRQFVPVYAAVRLRQLKNKKSAV